MLGTQEVVQIVGHDLLSKEEIRYPDGEDQTCPKELDAPSQQRTPLSSLSILLPFHLVLTG